MSDAIGRLPAHVHPQNMADPIAGKGFGNRAGAWVIDLLVLFIVNSAIGLAVGIILGVALTVFGVEFSVAEDETQCLNVLAGLVLSLNYMVTFEWLLGASIGKLILGMRVVKVDGSPCDFSGALVRGVYRYVDGLVFGLPAYLSMKEPPHQRLGDKAGKTVVVGSHDPIIREAQNWWWLLVAGVTYAISSAVIQFLALLPAIRSA